MTISDDSGIFTHEIKAKDWRAHLPSFLPQKWRGVSEAVYQSGGGEERNVSGVIIKDGKITALLQWEQDITKGTGIAQKPAILYTGGDFLTVHTYIQPTTPRDFLNSEQGINLPAHLRQHLHDRFGVSMPIPKKTEPSMPQITPAEAAALEAGMATSVTPAPHATGGPAR